MGVGEAQEATLARWEPRIRALAKHKNVVCKLSGLGMLPVGLGLDDAWTDPASSETLAKLWRPYLTVCINAFGVDRCMFASNFPVDKVRWGVARLGSVGLGGRPLEGRSLAAGGCEHPTSNIQHPTFNIQHPTFNIQHLTCILYVVCCMFHRHP